MHFLFDLTSPARQFKRGMPHDDNGEYPDYNDKDSGDITETDGDPPGFMVYMPRDYWYVTSNLANDVPLTLAPRRNYNYVCAIDFNTFMSWEKGEVHEIKVGQWRKRPNKASYALSHMTYKIPAAYHRIVCQLVAKDMHADGQGSHESLRRQTYAREILDGFGDELKELKHSNLPPADFRSWVLTPILQRQLNGIYNGYGPSVHVGIARKGKELSILDVTRFYLQDDPTDPIFIQTYRRNLLYLPNPRWHLGVVMGKEYGSSQAAIDHYKKVMDNHYAIMLDLEMEGHKRYDNNNIPLLSYVKIKCIIDEGLEDFFKEELQNVVRDISLIRLHLLTQLDSIA